MISFKRRAILGLAAAMIGSISPLSAYASNTQPLRIILPFSPGSGVDSIMRTAQPALSEALGGRPVVLENQPGAGGITGTNAIVKATPDGNTIGLVSNNHAVNPSLYKNMPYDGVKDLTQITILGSIPFYLVVNPSLPVTTPKELQAFLKAAPGKYNYGSSGNGTVIHLAGAMFVDAMGVDVMHVPYKGMGPMITDIMSNQVQFGVAAVSSVAGQVEAGQLRTIGLMSATRSPSLPKVPTLAEQGFPDVVVDAWFAVVGPAKMKPQDIEHIRQAFIKAFQDPTVKAAMDKQATTINPSTPEFARQYFQEEQDRFGKMANKLHLESN